MSANIWDLRGCEIGRKVEKGETLLVVECMKMEVCVRARKAGTVCWIAPNCRVGTLVGQGEPLVGIMEDEVCSQEDGGGPTAAQVCSPGSVSTGSGSAPGSLTVGSNPTDLELIELDIVSASSAKKLLPTELSISALHELYLKEKLTPEELVQQISDSMDLRDAELSQQNAGNIWITRFTSAEALDRFRARGLSVKDLKSGHAPLYGIPFAVKDNIDVAGVVTTGGVKGAPVDEAAGVLALAPKTKNANVVERLLAAGAILIGKTNLDQFATGLVGTRSPYGAVTNSFLPEYTSGGSSSGSAVAVALGFCTFSLGTDTAGSGRVPASLNNLVGVKPSRTVISNDGVLPACATLDCVSIFGLTAADCGAVLEVCDSRTGTTPAAADLQNAFSSGSCGEQFCAGDELPAKRASVGPSRGLSSIGRTVSKSVLGDRTRRSFRFGVPKELCWFFEKTPKPDDVEKQANALVNYAVSVLEKLGGQAVPVDYAPFRKAADFLYHGPWVAERTIAVKNFLRDNNLTDNEQKRIMFDPVVQKIVGQGDKYSASDCFEAMYALAALKSEIESEVFEEVDVILTPTLGAAYTIAQVMEDPVQTNTNHGFYTNFMNLLDLAGIAVPVGFLDLSADDQPGSSHQFSSRQLPFGVTICGPAFSDRELLRLGRGFQRVTKLPLGKGPDVTDDWHWAGTTSCTSGR